MYYFNIQTRQCEMFEYGGCYGNENNFLTLEECQERCVVPGQYPFSCLPACPLYSYEHGLFFSPQSLFSTEKPNFCFMEQDPGICRGYFSRYFYNKESQQCEKFKYGGCLGNQNNFKALEECQIACQDNCKCLVVVVLIFIFIFSLRVIELKARRDHQIVWSAALYITEHHHPAICTQTPNGKLS
uniref:Tissue factor pathway inhibitor n=1 Tax=Chelonoidis abingdonii TaxID=106734 RepID=A0A8C0JAT2_CHEAB